MTILDANTGGFSIRQNPRATLTNVVSLLVGNNKLATSDAPETMDVDGLMRAAYNNALPALFGGVQASASGKPMSTPDFSFRNVIRVFRRNVFPKDTVWRITNDASGKQWDAVQDVLATMKFKQKLNYVVEEASLMGYCGLRTVYDNDTAKWYMNVVRKEQLEITKDPKHQEDIIAIGVVWYSEEGGKTYAHKEKWTKELFYTWPRKEVGSLGAPKFNDKEASTEPNTYGEIPITIVPHLYDPWNVGRGALRHDDILAAQSLVELRDKRKRAHLQFMKPPVVRKNHDDVGSPVCLDPDAVIDLTTGEGEHEADLFLLESQGVPESAIVEIKEWVDGIYDNAGLTPPSQRENFAAGGVVKSGVALEILTEEEEKTINDLRDDGYSEVTRHVEKIVRMGLALKGDAATPFASLKTLASAPNPFIELVFPAISSPSDADISEKISMLRDSHLSAEEKAKREAQVFGITDEAEIGEIQANWEEAAKIAEPTVPNFGGA